MLFGYARTSTPDQVNEMAAQEKALTSHGIQRIFTEQAATAANRPVLKVCLGFLRENDSLAVTKADRLARCATDLLAIIADLDARRIELVILSFAGHVFSTRHPDSQFTLKILGSIAEWEREIMFERKRGGLSKAFAQGRSKGRPPRINSEDVKALDGTMSVTQIARKLNISRSSTYRMLQKPVRTV